MQKTKQPRWPAAPLAVILFFIAAFPVFGAGLKQLPGHVPEIAKKLVPIGHLSGMNELHLAIGLPLRDPAGLDQFLAEVYDPASPNYRHFLTPVEFTARFSATEADYQAVKQFAQANGFKITGEHGNRMLLDVQAKAADVERAFHIKLNKFKHPTEARDFYAPDAEPTVAADLPVADIQGLSDCYRPQPKLREMDLNAIAPKSGGSGSGGSFLGDDFRHAYVSGSALTGAGQAVGLLQFDGFYASDIAAYAALAGGGRTNIIIETVLTDTFNGNPTTGPNSGNSEVSLDIEMAMAMAPGLSRIVVFEANPVGGNANTILAAMVARPEIKQLSSSWGWSGGANTTTENYFKTMAAQGQSFFNASGDSDAFLPGQVDNSSQANYPSGSPNITQVGGTTLTMSGSGATYVSETVWNRGGGVGSSGGISSNAMPVWQQGVSMAFNGGSATTRNVPDVALTAESCYVKYRSGSSGTFGGTSCAAPLWAGFMALVNQQVAIRTGSTNNSVGFINPQVYEIARESIYNSVFYDTITGDNTWSSSPNQFYAVPGYDLCTGLGTPAGTNLINALAVPDALVVTTNRGFTSGGIIGGPFSPSALNYTFTNSGASSLNWSIVNTSAWLTVSSGSGTLASGAQAAVTVSVTTAANALPVGNYSATIWFSNVTSQVAHGRLFNLQVNDTLMLLTTNVFTVYGAVGGPFYPGTQSVVFTNLDAAPVNWSIINTSAWLSVSPAGGTVSGNTAASMTVSTNANVAALLAGANSATLVLSNQTTHSTHDFTVTALVGQSLVQNGGFETGDFSGWTFVGNTTIGTTIYNGVESTADGFDVIHSGTFGAFLGDTNPAVLSQTLPTAPGQSYLLSFWLNNPVSGMVQEFTVNWNTNGVTNTIFHILNPPAFGWTNCTFILTATASNTVLQLRAENEPNYFGLDDVSVIQIPLPSVASFGWNNNSFTLGWNSLAGIGYVVQYKTNLTQTNWFNLSTNTASSTVTIYTNNSLADPSRFYRIRRLP